VTRPATAAAIIAFMSAVAREESIELSRRIPEKDERAAFGRLCGQLRAIAQAVESLPPGLIDSQPGVPWREMIRLPDILERPGFRPDGVIICQSLRDPLCELEVAATRLRFYLVEQERRSRGRPPPRPRLFTIWYFTQVLGEAPRPGRRGAASDFSAASGSGMMAGVSGIYDTPELYELTCSYRDVPTEVDALQRWFADLYPERVRTLLELAAGPAEHTIEFARRGTDVTALDLSPAMCDYARSKAVAAGLPVEVVRADMRSFALPQRFDAAITMLNSVCHLMTLDDLVDHLRAVAAHLNEGGLYVMELGHPADQLSPSPRTSSDWVTEAGGSRVAVRWGGPSDRMDPITQVTPEHVVVTVQSADGTIRTATDTVPSRFWTATEVEAATRLAGGYEIAARYGDFEGSPLEAPAAWRMIYVLRNGERP
jgi:SAM-dependent methyltransferase